LGQVMGQVHGFWGTLGSRLNSSIVVLFCGVGFIQQENAASKKGTTGSSVSFASKAIRDWISMPAMINDFGQMCFIHSSFPFVSGPVKSMAMYNCGSCMEKHALHTKWSPAPSLGSTRCCVCQSHVFDESVCA